MFKLILLGNGSYFRLYMTSTNHFAAMYGTISLSKLLDISTEKFKKIVKNNNAIYKTSDQQFIFKTIQDGENAIDQLTPYLVLSKINGTLSNINEQKEWYSYTKYFRSTSYY